MKSSVLFLISISFFLCLSCAGETTGPQTGSGTAPPNFYLNQNFPNPFNDTTTIEYGIPSTGGSNSFVSVIVYDFFQQEVRVLASGHFAGNNYSTKWDGRNSRGIQVPSGEYTIQMRGYSPQTVIITKLAIKQ